MERRRNARGGAAERPLLYNGRSKFGNNLKKHYLEDFTMYFNIIAKIIAERTGCDESAVTPESKFTDLGIDSLDTVELLMNLEDETGLEIELDEKVETVGQLDSFIQRKAQA